MSIRDGRQTLAAANSAVRINGSSSNSMPERTSSEERFSLNGAAATRRTSLSLPPGMSLAAWRRLGRQIYVISDSSAWWLGDWLLYGQSNYPDRYRRAIAETALDYQTLRNYAWVARKFTLARRRDKLSFQHHAEVASLPEADQDKWLAKAEEHGWSRNELRRQIKDGKRANGDGEELTYVQMSIVAERKLRWQKAAETSEQELLEWIVSTLDSAAQSALEPVSPAGLPDHHPQVRDNDSRR